MIIHQFQCLKDNYGYLLEDRSSGKVVCIDTPDADAIISYAKSSGLKIDEVWNTHWHADHAGGNQKIHDEFGAKCIGPEEVSKHGFLLHEVVKAGDEVTLGAIKSKVIDVSGHTIGQIAYYFAEDNAVFVGDAMFALGCGRIFEGNPEMAFASLDRLMALPNETLVYCAHEYSAANADFCESLNLSNPLLAQRIADIRLARSENKATVPFELGVEKSTSPYLLADFSNLQKELGLVGQGRLETFTFVRKAKDNY